MFQPKRLYETVLILPKKYTNELFHKLGEEKIVQFKEFKEEFKHIPSIESPEVDSNDAVKALMSLEYVIDKLGIKSGKIGKKSNEPYRETEEIVKNINEILDEVNKEIRKRKTKVEKIEASLKFINSLERLEFMKDTISFLFDIDNQKWQEIIKELEKKEVMFSFIRKRLSGERALRFLSVEEEDAPTAKEILLNYEIDFVDGNINQIEKELRDEKTLLEKEIKNQQMELDKLPQEFTSKLLALKEQIENDLTILENKRKFLSSDFTDIINMWITVDKFSRFKEILKKVAGKNYLLYKQEAKLEDEPPTILKNFFLFKPFELLVEGFSLPGYEEIDPTFIVAIFFPVFFGIMLSDVGYGILLLLLSLAILFKDKSKTAFAEIMILCSMVTIVVGLIFGSWFGFSLTTTHFDPLKKPIQLMIISLVIGVTYVNLGLIMGLIESVKRRDWKFLINDVLLWIVFQLGILFSFLPNFGNNNTFNTILILSPVVARVVINGPLNILDFPKFFSTIISFVRLSALGMSTAWIAFAINLIYDVVRNVIPKGAIVGIVVLLVGHVFNFAFNTFGSFLQAMRLHYIEFFGQFYQGSGKKMKLFSLKQKGE